MAGARNVGRECGPARAHWAGGLPLDLAACSPLRPSAEQGGAPTTSLGRQGWGRGRVGGGRRRRSRLRGAGAAATAAGDTTRWHPNWEACHCLQSRIQCTGWGALDQCLTATAGEGKCGASRLLPARLPPARVHSSCHGSCPAQPAPGPAARELPPGRCGGGCSPAGASRGTVALRGAAALVRRACWVTRVGGRGRPVRRGKGRAACGQVGGCTRHGKCLDGCGWTTMAVQGTWQGPEVQRTGGPPPTRRPRRARWRRLCLARKSARD